MRFLLSIPLPLLLILCSLVTFDSHADPFNHDFVSKHGQSTPVVNRSLNDIQYANSSYGHVTIGKLPAPSRSMLRDPKPMRLESGSKDVTNTTYNFTNLSLPQLEHELKTARLLEQEYNNTKNKANETLQNETKKSVETFRAYDDAQKEWESLQAIADQESKDLKNIVEEADKTITDRGYELPGLTRFIEENERALGPLKNAYEKAKNYSDEVSNAPNELEKVKKAILEITPQIESQFQVVDGLRNKTKEKEEIVKEFKRTIISMNALIVNEKCEIATNKAKCAPYKLKLRNAQTDLKGAEGNRDQAQRNEVEPNEKYQDLVSKESSLQSLKFHLEGIISDIDLLKMYAERNLNKAESAKDRIEKPLLKAQDNKIQVALDIQNAKSNKTLAEEKLRETLSSGSANKANIAYAKYILAKEKNEEVEKEIDKLKLDLEEYRKNWLQQHERVLALKKEQTERSNKPATASSTVLVIVAPIGTILLILVVIGGIVFFNKRAGKINAGGKNKVEPNPPPTVKEPNPPPEPLSKNLLEKIEVKRREVAFTDLPRDIEPKTRKKIEEHYYEGAKIKIVSNTESGVCKYQIKCKDGRGYTEIEGINSKLVLLDTDFTMKGPVPTGVDYSGDQKFEGDESTSVDGKRPPLRLEDLNVFYTGSTSPGIETEREKMEREQRAEGGCEDQPMQSENGKQSKSILSWIGSFFCRSSSDDEPAKEYISRKKSGKRKGKKREDAGQEEPIEIDKTQPSGAGGDTQGETIPLNIARSAQPESNKSSRNKRDKSKREKKVKRSKRSRNTESRTRTSRRNRSKRESFDKKSRPKKERKYIMRRKVEDSGYEASKYEKWDSSSSSDSLSTRTFSAIFKVFTRKLKAVVPSFSPEYQDALISDLASATHTQKKVPMDFKELSKLADVAKEVVYADDRLIEMTSPATVYTDIHGLYSKLMETMASYSGVGLPPAWKNRKFVFCGDIVDRGLQSLESLVFLLHLKVRNPTSVALLRGNHEAENINGKYGFKEEIFRRFPADQAQILYEKFNEVFYRMPLVCRIDKRVVCMHGGIPKKTLAKLEDINLIPKILKDPMTNEIARDLLWSDPQRGLEGFAANDERGCGHFFGEDEVIKFCEKHNVDMIVRGHQVMMNGYEFFAGRKLVTIFTAHPYYETKPNHGATMHFERDGRCGINKFVESNENDAEIRKHHRDYNDISCYKSVNPEKPVTQAQIYVSEISMTSKSTSSQKSRG